MGLVMLGCGRERPEVFVCRHAAGSRDGAIAHHGTVSSGRRSFATRTAAGTGRPVGYPASERLAGHLCPGWLVHAMPCHLLGVEAASVSARRDGWRLSPNPGEDAVR